MSSFIATIATIFFIILLYTRDFNKEREVSSAVWIAVLWMMYCAALPPSYWLDTSQGISVGSDLTEGDPIDRLFLITLLLTAIPVLLRRKRNWKYIFEKNSLLIILFIYMGISFLWSDSPEISLKRWIRTSGDLIMVLLILTEKKPAEAVDALIRRCMYLLIPLSVLFIKYYRDLGIAYTFDGSMTMWIGVTTHKNALGSLTVISSVYFLWSIIRNWRKDNVVPECILLIMSLWMLNGSETSSSKTAIVVFFAGLCILLLMHIVEVKKKEKYLDLYVFMILFFFSAALILTSFLVSGPLMEIVTNAIGRDSSLTGRVPLWNTLLQMGKDNPVFGTGYGSFWIGNRTHDLWYLFLWQPSQGHNGYIDVYLELGIVGILILFSVLIASYRNLKMKLPYYYSFTALRLSFIIMILLTNMAESSLTKGTSFLWFLFLLFVLDVPGYRNFEERESKLNKQLSFTAE